MFFMITIQYLLIGVLCTAPVLAAVGTITEQVHTPPVIKRSQESLQGLKGTDVEMRDAIKTSQGKIGIVFEDQTKVQITENSKLVIDEFVYDPNQKTSSKLAIKVALGTVRYASGAIAKTNPQAVAIKTPTATIGVRGTDFTTSVDELGRSTIILLPSCSRGWTSITKDCKTGEISVETQEGIVIMNQAFQATVVTSRETRPKPPVILSLSESDINNMIMFAPPQLLLPQKDPRKDLNKSVLDIDFLASSGLTSGFDKSTEELKKLYVNRLEQNMLDADFLANILDQVDAQMAIRAAVFAKSSSVLPDHTKESGVVATIDGEIVELCRSDGSNRQCVSVPKNTNATILQVQGVVGVQNRVNSGGSTTITLIQSD